MSRTLWTVALAMVFAAGCKKDPEPTPGEDPGPPSPLLDVESTESWSVPGMTGEAYVMRAEGSIPYIYASNRADLARVTGFTVARDRFFMMDLLRRLSQGTISGLLGDLALESDLESRGIGMSHVTDTLLAAIEANPEHLAIMDGYAAGVNAHIQAVRDGQLPPPSEYATLGPILGVASPVDLMGEFTRRDMAAIGATLTYNLGFESGDVGRAASFAALEGLFDGQPLGDLRQAGVYDDIWYRVEPVYDVSSSPGWGTAGARRSAPVAAPGVPSEMHVPAEVLDRLQTRLDRIQARFGHDWDSGFGSNAWAVGGYASADGRSLLAGDGHLPLSQPALFYQLGMDTAHLGDGSIHQVGLAFPGLPTMAVGTNGDVAWSQTQVFGDITDWYAEQLELDAQGLPARSLFQGSWQDLSSVDETYEIADVAFLGSVGRTETWTRWQTFDGRWLAEVEGRSASPSEQVGPGEALINLQGSWVVPGDIDGDGVISAVSFDYVGLDASTVIAGNDGFGLATDVHSFREATKHLVAYSQNIIASDANGDILYTGYQAVPCRSGLPRNPDGTWVEGADPSMLLDGTQYGGFSIEINAEGKVDEGFADDPSKCVVPFEEYPQSISPPEGFVMSANNDIGAISTDGSLADDPWYVGGPWLEGYRAKRLDDLLAAEVAAGTADIDAMVRMQGDHRSTVADQWLGLFLDSIDDAEALAAGPAPLPDTAEARTVALWTDNSGRLIEARDRLQAWLDAGVPARAGVETFYMSIEPGDLDHAVATMIWAAWVGHFMGDVFDDEGFPGVWHPTGDSGRTRTLTRMFAGRGPGNPEGMASYNPETEESAFFDVLSTVEVETSDELILRSLVEGLDTLTAANETPGEGGFGTDDMSQWLWGLRHLAQFESLLGELLAGDDEFGFLIELFSITPDALPLADNLAFDDPRRNLPWFPRHGDHLNVDASNPGFNTREWQYGSGPVFRMVIALGPDGAEGVNMLPGGQSGLSESPYWADQAARWLGNETWTMRTTVDQVLEGATHRETFQ